MAWLTGQGPVGRRWKMRLGRGCEQTHENGPQNVQILVLHGNTHQRASSEEAQNNQAGEMTQSTDVSQPPSAASASGALEPEHHSPLLFTAKHTACRQRCSSTFTSGGPQHCPAGRLQSSNPVAFNLAAQQHLLGSFSKTPGPAYPD